MAGTHTPPVRGGMNEEQVQSLNPIATARTGQNTLETTMQDDIETETTIGALIAEKTADGTNAEEAGVEVEAEVQIGGAERTTIQGDPMRKREMLSLVRTTSFCNEYRNQADSCGRETTRRHSCWWRLTASTSRRKSK